MIRHPTVPVLQSNPQSELKMMSDDFRSLFFASQLLSGTYEGSYPWYRSCYDHKFCESLFLASQLLWLQILRVAKPGIAIAMTTNSVSSYSWHRKYYHEFIICSINLLIHKPQSNLMIISVDVSLLTMIKIHHPIAPMLWFKTSTQPEMISEEFFWQWVIVWSILCFHSGFDSISFAEESRIFQSSGQDDKASSDRHCIFDSGIEETSRIFRFSCVVDGASSDLSSVMILDGNLTGYRRFQTRLAILSDQSWSDRPCV